MKKSALRLALPALLIGVSIIVLVPGGAKGHEGAKGIVFERMEHMKALAASMKALAPFAFGEAVFDGGEVARLAETISARTGQEMVRLFPKDSFDTTSEANPAIWQRWDQFERLAEDAQKQAKALAQAALVKTTVGANFMRLAGACKSCHIEFRQEKAKTQQGAGRP
ncbi:c-type cytochrome [Magnetovibrio blakemorei]|uniref:Cytochrome c n=1 Tax=Magnetovibrio blakemorei TaxID=28181 RepID=A0A1E5QBV3_9PROT|nr:cytochrome c [Magnetovibrio blakemorei]OEJ69550.1 hypothetical protein BEN30_02630 [Magnetovibrio blakemorei]